MNHKEGRNPRATMAKPRPFVVTSVVTKRYTPTTRKAPLQKLPLRIPPPRPAKERPSVPRWVSTHQTSRPGSLPTVVPKVEPRRPSPKTMPMPAPNKTTRVPKTLPLRLVPSADKSLPGKTSVPKPLKMAQRVNEGKPTGGYPKSVPARSKQATTANEFPPRPSCVPRTGIMAASKGKQDVTVKVSTTGPRNLGVRHKLFVNIGTAKTPGCVGTTDTFVKESVVAGGCRTGTTTRNGTLILPRPIACPYTVEPVFHVAWSPPGSPDLSSFPSQSWTIVVDVDVNQIKTPTKICYDETLGSICDAAKLSGAGKPKDSCERCESISSPSLSSSSTAVETPESRGEPNIRSHGTAEICTLTKEPSAEVSHTVCGATITSPSRNGATSSIAALAKVMDKSQVSSPSKAPDIGNGARTVVRCIAEIARTFFSSSRHTWQSGSMTTPFKTMSTNVSRIRKTFIPPLDRDAKVSKNPTTQLGIEMLRARRKVAGSGMFDPRLLRLGPLSAMAVLIKMGTSSPDSPGRD